MDDIDRMYRDLSAAITDAALKEESAVPRQHLGIALVHLDHSLQHYRSATGRPIVLGRGLCNNKPCPDIPG